jgi:hypothetical protein
MFALLVTFAFGLNGGSTITHVLTHTEVDKFLTVATFIPISFMIQICKEDRD